MAPTGRHLATLVIALAGAVATMAADAATIAYYTFENGASGEVARGKGSILDSSGNGLNGTPLGRPRYRAVSNPDSTLALHLNGSTAHVHVPDSPLLALTHSLTLEAYVYLRGRNTGIVGSIIGRGDDRYAYDPYYIIVNFLQGGVVEFTIENEDATASQVFSPAALPVRQWVHVAGTLDDATGLQSLYINGELVASKFTTIRPFAKLQKGLRPGLSIGGSGNVNDPDTYLFGSLDGLRISDVALDPSDFLPPP
ncbi:LamG domain-containing protein [Ideonella sp. YS5]|uniref:LamG domain-containing protein n=1 Tax=Ideonella sp. YS5 TaxID=3453714 RepID=UPI003EEA198F